MIIFEFHALDGNGGPCMYAILLVSIIGLAVVIERFRFYTKSWTNPEPLERKLGELLYKGDAEGASSLVREKETSLHRLFRAAVDHWQAPSEALKMLLEQEVRHEVYRWEKGYPFFPRLLALNLCWDFWALFWGLSMSFELLQSPKEQLIWLCLLRAFGKLC